MADLQSFKLYLRRKGYKPATIKGHVEVMARVIRDTSLKEIDAYFLKLTDSELKPSYLNHIVTSIRKYGEFAGMKALTKIEFFRNNRESNKAILSDSEIEALITLPAPVGGKYLWHYNKNSLYWKCLAFSGARTNEIANLTIDQVDFGTSIFNVKGKMGERKVPISPVLIDDLREHIKKLKGKLMFPSMRIPDQPIGKETWNYDFRQRLKRLGIKRENLTPYSMRHSFITRNWDMGLPVLQKIVGHKRIETTAHYTHLVTKDIVAAIKKDPLAKSGLVYVERFRLFRENVRALLTTAAQTPDEEKKMLLDLLNLP